MQDLIQPTLFWVSRIGLLFAIILGMAGTQVRLFFRIEPFAGQTVSFELGRHAIQFCHWPIWPLRLSKGYMASMGSPKSKLHAEQAYESNGVRNDEIARISVPFPGVIVLTNIQNVTEVAIKHWLTVTVFALYYAILKWVYRKRPEPSSEPQ